MSLTRIGSIGINTGIAFAGVTTIVTLNTANDALSIGATVNVGSGITLGKDGDVFFTGIATGNASGLTALNASNISSGTVPTARLGSGTASSSTFLRGDSTFQTVDTNLVADTSPQLGGNLDVNAKNIVFSDSSGASDDRLTFGASTDLSIYHDGSHSRIDETGTGNLMIQSDNAVFIKKGTSENIAIFNADGAVELYHDNEAKILTKTNGATIQDLTASGAYLDIKGSDGVNGKVYGVSGTTIGFLDNQNHFLIKGVKDGAVELYYDNSKKFQTYSSGIQFFGNIKNETDGTNQGLFLGTANDFQFYHDGNRSAVNNRTGELRLSAADNIRLGYAAAGNTTSIDENYAVFKLNGAVELFHDNTKQCETSANGLAFPSGKGIDFSATADGGTGSVDELLDDYEAGTFTATLTGIGGGTNPSFSAQTSSAGYTKIGGMVHVYAYLFNVNVSGTGSGTITVISGLPFASGSHYYPGVITHDTLLTGCTGGYVGPSSNSPTFIPIGDNTTSGKLPATGNTKYIMFAATYYTPT
mgnify:FL=1